MMRGITSILFPVDFSPASFHAIDFVIDVSRKTGAFVTIYHAQAIPIMADTGTRPVLMENQQKLTEEQFRDLKVKYPGLETIPHRFDITTSSFEAGIEYFLENKNERVDLIIMGTSGATGVKEFFSGTRAADVIDNSNIPVLVIPEKARTKPLKKMVFAYDYKEISNPGSLDILKSLLEAYHADLQILNIAERPQGSRDDDFASAELIERQFPGAHFIKRTGNDIEKEIVNYLLLQGADLLAVLPREHGFFERLFQETTTEKLAYHSLVPLLVLR